MDRAAFWKIIDEARENCDDVQDVPSMVVEALVELEPDEILSFMQHRHDLEAESYRWDLWAAAYIINGGCSNDGFDYFRGWLMANGSKRWYAAMKSPETIGEFAEFDEAECEDMLAAAYDAYQQSTDEDFPSDRITISQPADPIGKQWGEDDLETLFPKLYRKFADG